MRVVTCDVVSYCAWSCNMGEISVVMKSWLQTCDKKETMAIKDISAWISVWWLAGLGVNLYVELVEELASLSLILLISQLRGSRTVIDVSSWATDKNMNTKL